MTEISWDIPFDPAEVGNVPMFVWCPTEELAEEFVEQYHPVDARSWVHRWHSYKEETIYAIPANHSERDWLFGPRSSLCGSYSHYVPRVFYGARNYPEVGDLL